MLQEVMMTIMELFYSKTTCVIGQGRSYHKQRKSLLDNSFSESDLICKIMSKSMSIRNGKSLDLKEQQYIINSLFACKETMICPVNLKTYVQINYSEIENMFK